VPSFAEMFNEFDAADAHFEHFGFYTPPVPNTPCPDGQEWKLTGGRGGGRWLCQTKTVRDSALEELRKQHEALMLAQVVQQSAEQGVDQVVQQNTPPQMYEGEYPRRSRPFYEHPIFLVGAGALVVYLIMR